MFVRAFRFQELLLVPPNYPPFNHLHHSRNIDRRGRDHRQFLYDPHSLALLAHILRLQNLRLPVDRHPTVLPRLAAPQIITH